MATLHVRNIPDALYGRLRRLAAADNQSLSAEVAVLLESAVNNREQHIKRKNVLAELRRHRFTPPANAPDSLTLLREDRQVLC